MSDPHLRGFIPRPSRHDPAEPGGFVFDQETPSAEWTIAHNLGVKPSVSLYTVGGVEFDAEVVHLSAQTCKVFLNTPIAGFARLI